MLQFWKIACKMGADWIALKFHELSHQFCYLTGTAITTVRLFVHKNAGCLWQKKEPAIKRARKTWFSLLSHFIFSFSVFIWISTSGGLSVAYSMNPYNQISFSSVFSANAHNVQSPSQEYNPMIRKVPFSHSIRCFLCYSDDQEQIQWWKADFGRCPGK